VFLVLVVLGLLAVGDAAAETSYLVIPKQEQSLSAGCCTGVAEEELADRYVPHALTEARLRPWVQGAYYAGNLVMVLVLGISLRWAGLCGARWLAGLLLGALLLVPVTALFLIDIAAPTVLHLPYHHCLYDLIPRAPDAIVAVALFLGGSFSVGWACVAYWLGRAPETVPLLDGQVRQILQMALFCYSGSLLMMALEIALAS
jgi:hypothetical protein